MRLEWQGLLFKPSFLGRKICLKISDEWDVLIRDMAVNQKIQEDYIKLLEETLDMNEKGVAAEIEKIHSDYTSVIQYNDENSLCSVLTIAYLSSMSYYFKPV